MPAKVKQWTATTENSRWQEKANPESGVSAQANLRPVGISPDKWRGFGGCFNELGWIALSWVEKELREKIMKDLFDQKSGCKFSFCRLPVGANDYAETWYSLNETDGDFAMKNFSIERDRNYIIPYIKMALQHSPDINFFASPWSPPTWMKFPKSYNYGTFVMKPEYLKAYALYFLKFVRAYREEGIEISQIHVQNEPNSDQKFPSCVWTGEKIRDFIRDYMGPLFEKENESCEIWLGTIEKHMFNQWPATVLANAEARGYIKGIGYQWAGKYMVAQTHNAWPQLPIIQTENECGDGRNTWEYAMYVFDLFRSYITDGVVAYTYWNMILPTGGESTWGWKQNSLITIDPDSKEVTYQPEYYIMKHFSHFVQNGAQVRHTQGQWSAHSVLFKNPDGTEVLVVSNPLPQSEELRVDLASGTLVAELEPRSFNTFVLE